MVAQEVKVKPNPAIYFWLLMSSQHYYQVPNNIYVFHTVHAKFPECSQILQCSDQACFNEVFRFTSHIIKCKNMDHKDVPTMSHTSSYTCHVPYPYNIPSTYHVTYLQNILATTLALTSHRTPGIKHGFLKAL